MISPGAVWLIWIIVFIVIMLIVHFVWFCNDWAIPTLIGAIVAFITVALIIGFADVNTSTDAQSSSLSNLLFIAFLLVVFAALWAIVTRPAKRQGFISDVVISDCESGQEKLVKRTVSDGCQIRTTKYRSIHHHDKKGDMVQAKQGNAAVGVQAMAAGQTANGDTSVSNATFQYGMVQRSS